MRSQQQLVLEQLDRKIKPLYKASKMQVPVRGWIHTIRTALNMTLEQLGNKMGMTKQGVRRMETGEAAGSISIKSMREVANAMDMTFVYGFVPRAGTLEKLLEEKSNQLAREIVHRTNQNMLLEDQGTSKRNIEKAIRELTLDIKREIRRSIWD